MTVRTGGIDRRRLLVGGAGVAATTAIAKGAAAETPTRDQPGESGVAGAPEAGNLRSNPTPPMAGLDYLHLNYADFTSLTGGAARVYTGGGNFGATGDFALSAPLQLPAGSHVTELEAYYTASGAKVALVRYPATGGAVGPDLALPASAASATATLAANHIVANSSESLAIVLKMGNASATCRGVRVGYAAPPTGLQFIGITRIFDSRPGPLGTGIRSISVKGAVPADAEAVLVQISVINGLRKGNISVFPGDASFTGTPSALWDAKSTDLATPAFTALDAAKTFNVRLKGTANYIVDLLGYIV